MPRTALPCSCSLNTREVMQVPVRVPGCVGGALRSPVRWLQLGGEPSPSVLLGLWNCHAEDSLYRAQEAPGLLRL